MQTKRPLAPAIINKWDRYLLLHHPQTWTARTHLVFYYGLLFFVGLTVISYLAPDDPRSMTSTFVWITFVTLLSFIGFVVWMIYLLRFNVFKRYGITSPWDRVKTFLLLFLGTAVFALFPFVQPRVESARANKAYPDEVMTHDINALNTGILQLEYDSLYHTWSRDTIVRSVLIIEKETPPAPGPDATIDVVTTDTTTAIQWRDGIKLVGKKEMANRLAEADSLQRLNDSTYIFLSAPDYAFVGGYRAESLNTAPLSSAGVYRKMLQQSNKDEAALRHNVDALIDKYRLIEPDFSTYDTTRMDIIRKRYHTAAVNDSINNIMERKKRWSHDMINFAVRVFLYVSLVLSLLVFVFRHSTVKTFFLSLLTAVVLMILTMLIQVFAGGPFYSFFNWMLFYFLLFLGISIGTFFTQKRRVVHGIALNLFVLLVPFIPLIITADYFEYQRIKQGFLYTLYSNQDYWMQMAEWEGLALILILLGTYIHKAYRRWYALAEE